MDFISSHPWIKERKLVRREIDALVREKIKFECYSTINQLDNFVFGRLREKRSLSFS